VQEIAEFTERMSKLETKMKVATGGINKKISWQALLSVTFLIMVAGSVQLYVPYPFDTDTAFHAAVGRLIYNHGIFHTFPWTPFSYLSDHYADYEFIFHLMFAALPNISFTTSSRIVGTFADASILLAIYFILNKEKVKYAGIWAVLPLVVSSGFFFRFVLVRPHLLAITMSLLLLWAMSRNKFIIIAVISFLFPWTYIAFWQLPLIILFATESARLLSGERICWKALAILITGIILGIISHPYSINLVKLNWIVINKVLIQNSWGSVQGIDLGGEFIPPTAIYWKEQLLLGIGLVFISLYWSWHNRKVHCIYLAFTIATCIFLILTAKSVRFMEYFIPFAVAAFAINSTLIKWKYVFHVVLAVSLCYMLFFNIENMKFVSKRDNDMPPYVAEFLKKNIPEGAQVFTPTWKSTGTFMLALPERRFMVGLDPTLFQLKDPELYKLWYEISHKPPPETPEIICRNFNSRYVLTYNNVETDEFIQRLYFDPRVKKLLTLNYILLFDLGDLPACRDVKNIPISFPIK
jgi:hypothetical protein